MNTQHLRFRSNRVRDIIALFREELTPLYGAPEVEAFVERLFEGFLGWDRVRLLTSKEQTIDQSDLLRFHWALEDLLRHRPIQHIVGHTDFCGCRIEVGPDVLIPRPETEEMVQHLINNETTVARRPGARLLDLCTGSGCIAIALKRAFPEAEVTAVDLSDQALAVARRNAEANGTEVRLVQADVLAGLPQLPTLAHCLITANPPYVRHSERHQMAPNVLDYEPHMALFVPDDDPLLFYRTIGSLALRCLAPDGLLAVEVNEALADDTARLLHQQGFSTELHADFRQRPRWLACRRGNIRNRAAASR